MKLSNLKITAFRGATRPLTLEFDQSKRVSMIFGENGNGKSTICDAIVCLCTENEHGSLDDKSSTSKSFFTSIANKPQDVSISLTTDAKTFIAKLSGQGVFVKTPQTGHPIVRHLRRSQITQLIEEQPAKRYEKLQSYIAVNSISHSEDMLRNAKKAAEIDLKLAIATLDEMSTTLENTWKKEGSPMKTWEKWAEHEALKDISEETARYESLHNVISHWSSLLDEKSRYEKALNELEAANKELEVAEAKLKEELDRTKNGNADLLTLLQSAKKYITTKDLLIACPICDNNIQKDAIVKSLSAKIDAMEDLKKISEQVHSEREKVKTKKGILNSALQTYYQKIENAHKSFQIIKEAPYADLSSKLTFLSSEEPVNDKINSFLPLYKDINDEIDIQRSVAEAIKTRINQSNLLKGQYNSIISSREKSGRTNTLVKAMDDSIKIIEKARKDFVQGELDAISSEVDSLYQKIHPKEKLGGISLALKKTTKHSLELNADFYTEKSIAPQSVYSESHLDTLGICVFLALAKRYGSKDSILILDDVVMSVDENHLDRFIDLLHDEDENFGHILITTHYRPWRDRYRYNRAPSSKVHFVELRDWSLEGGIKIQNGKLLINELKAALADESSFDRQKIISAAGIVLENIFDFFAVKYACRLPRNTRNEYTLNELSTCFSSKLSNALKIQHFKKETPTGKYSATDVIKETHLNDLLSKIKELTIIRNWVGAHYNPSGSLVSDKDVKEFANLTLELAELITCPENGQFPDKDHSGSYWETKSGSIRLHPLKEPK